MNKKQTKELLDKTFCEVDVYDICKNVGDEAITGTLGALKVLTFHLKDREEIHKILDRDIFYKEWMKK